MSEVSQITHRIKSIIFIDIFLCDVLNLRTEKIIKDIFCIFIHFGLEDRMVEARKRSLYPLVL